ncbi:hypothetical protein B0H66DRAFT_150976 [Apodospora peruviana]|uniref:TauD/TfdA-like domain-containing protein n=1 Tax=Apodospora peruviana TaxID=516989 RepID=A0AAE0MC25_9PEZI|nr:hypothetical protein B0H66DRAFT_150976 [Apodospora peruviana]
MAENKNEHANSQGASIPLSSRGIMEMLGSHPMAWTSEAFDTKEASAEPGYVVHLDKQELLLALESVKERGLAGDSITRDTFLLPSSGTQLEQVRRDIHMGSGIAIVRLGIDPCELADEDNIKLFLGVASHIGDKRGIQDRRGNVLTHVTSAKRWTVPQELRHGIHTNTGLAWHNDMGADVLALYVRGQAEKGGHTYIASSWTIYKELLMSYPDTLDLLTRHAWPIQITASPHRHVLAPLLQVYGNKILISVDPGRLGLHPVTAKTGLGSSIPDLTCRQLEALDVLTSLAARHRLRLDTKPGDMVFIQNWAMLHARDSYKDPENGPRRHLVRLWIRDSELGWNIPDSMRVPWDAAYAPDTENGGADTGQKKYPTVPAREYRPPKYTAGSAAFVLRDDEDVNCEE